MIFAALLTLVKDSGKVLQGFFNGRTKDNIRNLNPYGFFSNPPLNSKIVMLEDTSGSHYGVAYLDSVIPSLKSGEAAIGNFQVGSIIKFDESGNIDITCIGNKTVNISGNCTVNISGTISVTSTGNTTITTPLATLNGNLIVNGTITSTGNVTAPALISNGKTINDSHVHSGVTSGISNTGGVV